MPPYAEEETEAKIQLAKTKLNAAIEGYTKTVKDAKTSLHQLKEGFKF